MIYLWRDSTAGAYYLHPRHPQSGVELRRVKAWYSFLTPALHRYEGKFMAH